MGRRTRLAVVVVVAFIATVVLSIWADNVIGRQPTFTCSTPLPRGACSNTEKSMLSDMTLVMEPLPARLISVDVRPTPSDWKIDDEYQDGDWAALLTLEGTDPMLVVCYYSSDEMVGCQLP